MLYVRTDESSACGTSTQPHYLTVTELVFNSGLFCGIGALVGGIVGAWCGAGLVTILYAQSIWRSVKSCGAVQQPGADPASHPDGESQHHGELQHPRRGSSDARASDPGN